MGLIWSPGYYVSPATAYLEAVEAADGQALEPAVRTAVFDFVDGCEADGIWDAIKACCIMAGARTLAGALVPLVGTAPANNNFVSGDYDRVTGLEGNGSTKYLDSNRANNADPQDSNHNSVYASTLGASLALSAANSAGAVGANHIGLTDSRNRSATSSGISMQVGFCGHARSESGSFDYRSGGSTTNTLATSDDPTSDNLNLFRTNITTTPAFGTHRLSFYSIGEALDLALLDTRVSTLMTDLAAAIP